MSGPRGREPLLAPAAAPRPSHREDFDDDLVSLRAKVARHDDRQHAFAGICEQPLLVIGTENAEYKSARPENLFIGLRELPGSTAILLPQCYYGMLGRGSKPRSSRERPQRCPTESALWYLRFNIWASEIKADEMFSGTSPGARRHGGLLRSALRWRQIRSDGGVLALQLRSRSCDLGTVDRQALEVRLYPSL